MKITKNFGTLLLAAWLILSGVLAIFQIDIPNSGLLLHIVAVAAGVMLLLGK